MMIASPVLRVCWFPGCLQEALNEVLQAYIVHAMESGAGWLVPQVPLVTPLLCHMQALSCLRSGRPSGNTVDRVTCGSFFRKIRLPKVQAGSQELRPSAIGDVCRVSAQLACHLRAGRRHLTYSIFAEELTRRPIAECAAAFAEADAWFGVWQGGDVQPDEMLIIADQVRTRVSPPSHDDAPTHSITMLKIRHLRLGRQRCFAPGKAEMCSPNKRLWSALLPATPPAVPDVCRSQLPAASAHAVGLVAAERRLWMFSF